MKNDILNTALLGTAKRPIQDTDLPEEIKGIATTILLKKDEEEKFLQLAAFSLAYYKAGYLPTNVPKQASIAPIETKEYCSTAANQLAIQLFTEDNPNKEKRNIALEYWHHFMVQRNAIVRPSAIVAIMNWIERQPSKAKRKAAFDKYASILGNRGTWYLQQLGDEYKLLVNELHTIDFETASIEDRITLFTDIRHNNPQQAIPLLEKVWKTEKADTKQVFLGLLSIHLSSIEEDFLENCKKDKSKSVQDKAQELLLTLPEGRLITQLKEVAPQIFQIDTPKSFKNKLKIVMGVGSPDTYLVANKDISVEIRRFVGNELLNKKIVQAKGAEEVIISSSILALEIIAILPPTFWNTHFGISRQEICELMLNNKQWYESFLTAIKKWKDTEYLEIALKYIVDNNPNIVSEYHNLTILDILHPEKKIEWVRIILQKVKDWEFYSRQSYLLDTLLYRNDFSTWKTESIESFIILLNQNHYSSMQQVLGEYIGFFFEPSIVVVLQKLEEQATENYRAIYLQQSIQQIEASFILKQRIQQAF